MKNNKGFKFFCLVVLYICIAALYANTFIIVDSLYIGRQVSSGYLSNEKKFLEEDYYKSMGFDDGNISYLTNIITRTVQDSGVNSELSEDDVSKMESEVIEARSITDNVFDNSRFLVVNSDTGEIYSNTPYTSYEEFKKNSYDKCNIELEINDYQVESYIKTLNNETYEINDMARANGIFMESLISNGKVYISIPEKLSTSEIGRAHV